MDDMKTTKCLRELANTILELKESRASLLNTVLASIDVEIDEVEGYFRTEVIRLLNLKGDIEQ